MLGTRSAFAAASALLLFAFADKVCAQNAPASNDKSLSGDQTHERFYELRPWEGQAPLKTIPLIGTPSEADQKNVQDYVPNACNLDPCLKHCPSTAQSLTCNPL
jgi:hypothetical protein